MPLKEADITRQIRDFLKMQNIWHWKHWSGMGSAPGVSDILGCYQGRFMAIEVKRPGRKATDAQRRFIDNVNDAGGIGFVADSIEDVVEGLGIKGVRLF